MTIRIEALSTEYIHIPVTSDGDVTAAPVSIAIVARGTEPDSGDWQNAAWKPNTTPPQATVLIGPGTPFGLEQGSAYDVWVRVTESPEIPIRRAGSIYLT